MRKIIFGGLLASTMLVPAFAQNQPAGFDNSIGAAVHSAYVINRGAQGTWRHVACFQADRTERL